MSTPLAERPAVAVRRATPGDAPLLFEWFNDPATLAAFNSAPMAQSFVVEMLVGYLADDERSIWIAVHEDEPVGMVRITGDAVDIVIAPEHRGRRLATAALVAACERASGPLYALVQPENAPSLRAVAAAGFFEINRTEDAVTFGR